MRNFELALGTVALAALAAPCLARDGDARVVVGFKGGADASVLTGNGGEVQSVLESGRAVVVNIAPSRLAALRANASVAYVEEDGIVEASDKNEDDAKSGTSKGSGEVGATGRKPGTVTPPQPAQTMGWGVTKVWGTAAPAVTGLGVKVAIIDTGIDLTHPDLKANIAGNVTYVGGTSSGNDDNGHGSHVAGIVAAIDNTIGYVGVAPKASLYAVKVLDSRGSGYLSAVASGVDWARTRGMHIANMSLGGASSSVTLENACNNAQAAGVLLVVASGNSGDGNTATTETSYPAAYSSCVAVGATAVNDSLASFSSTGNFVELSGPGVSVPSTYKSGGYATLSGTSMASPHAAGLAALLWTPGTSTAATVRPVLDTKVRDLGPQGRDAGFGFGVVYYPGQ